MDLESLERGTARTAAQLRIQLAQMTLASQLLERAAQDEKSRAHLAALNQGICRMLRTVGRMELVCRLGVDEARPALAAVDLARMTRELGEEMAGLLAGAGKELTVSQPQRLFGAADESLLRQILLELVANGARVGDRVAVTLARKGDEAVFTVEDDGPGVPRERFAEVFGSGNGLPDWKQSGVGVAIARRAAELHGGRLMADPAPGRGLRVVVTIPLQLDKIENALESPALKWDRGGFSEALVGLSELLPAGAFAPGAERK